MLDPGSPHGWVLNLACHPDLLSSLSSPALAWAPKLDVQVLLTREQPEEPALRPERLQALICLQWRGDKSRALWERPQLCSEALVTGLIDEGAQMQTQESEFPYF